MLIRDFTKPEIDNLLNLCNFTPEEEEYFLLRAKNKTNIQIAFEMNVSDAQVGKLAKRVKSKIIRVI